MGAPITILGNVAVDRVDGGPPRPGGCPTFAAPLLRASRGSIVTRCAPLDRALFEPALAACPSTIVDSASTTAFTITNHRDERAMTVACTGDPWRPDELEGIPLEPWVHVAPLLAGDVGADVLAWLRAQGHRVALDGQGLVRVRAVGPLREEAQLDPDVLACLDVLKLSAQEAAVIATPFDAAAVRALGVPEIVVTHGADGAVVHAEGEAHRVPSPWVVDAPDPTGSGDAFMVSYVGARAAGADPVRAAALAATTVARMLEARHTR